MIDKIDKMKSLIAKNKLDRVFNMLPLLEIDDQNFRNDALRLHTTIKEVKCRSNSAGLYLVKHLPILPKPR